MHEPSYLDPLGSRLPALEQNILKLRSAQMVLVLFYAEQLKVRVLSLIQRTDSFMAHTGRAERVPQGTKNPVGKCLDALEADGALSADEKAEIRRLINYRNSVGHDVHELVADITSERSVRRSWRYLPENFARYDYEAVERLQYFLKLLGERQRTHHYIGTISFNWLQFRSAERVFLNEIKLLRRKIAKQWEARQQQIDDLNKQMQSAIIGSGETDPRHPSNQYDDGRLTLRGEEICYRLFDQGLSPMAVAHLMGLQLTSVRNRQRSWVKLGGKLRPAVDFETLPERKYYRRYND
ncbi:hypothetical protein L7D45_22005 [Brucella pseudogrignonensis]|uniref:hypothetical protein n=1 Tax=Brucella pseudogrignonensis TaxID=419475 RepID=UPI00190C918A|nr:hypothetical protein [Brucella pseudogrignonensis]MBK0022876.1 hypothetical protein [Ochrobactrum sp. S45]MBK0044891.1 hypothetical protein [Ochrobactrum sp. S46]UKK95359.1 hypothetical protein L7D45_22005 [Brucella pseudogrignonensis]